MDLHSIIIELYFPPCQVFPCFSPFCLFLPHAFVPGAQKTGSAAQADPVFSKISVSAEVFAFQIPHHPHIAGLAALVAPGE